jgi:hypothetical protein
MDAGRFDAHVHIAFDLGCNYCTACVTTAETEPRESSCACRTTALSKSARCVSSSSSRQTQRSLCTKAAVHGFRIHIRFNARIFIDIFINIIINGSRSCADGSTKAVCAPGSGRHGAIVVCKWWKQRQQTCGGGGRSAGAIVRFIASFELS